MAKLRDYRRVVGVMQLVYLAGCWLKRQAMRYTGVAVFIACCAMAIDLFGKEFFGHDLPITKLNAALIPMVVATLTFGMGNTLTGISNLFSSERLLMADANSLNLMEDRKKVDMAWHLAVLWERVFCYEVALEQTTQGNTRMQVHDKASFMATASGALKEACHQKLQQVQCGYDFSLVEDWYDGAFFTRGDCKLKEQYAANSAIRGARLKVGIPWNVKLQEALSGHPSPLWHNLTMKKIGMSVGSMIFRLNKRHVAKNEPDYFNAQDILWKDSQIDSLVRAHFNEKGGEVLADLQTSRRKMIRRIFSETTRESHHQVFWMFGRDFKRAMALRLAYDIEFAAGELNDQPMADIAEMVHIMGCKVFSVNKANRMIENARRNIGQFNAFLECHMAGLSEDPVMLRTAKTGYGLNRFGIQMLVQDHPGKAVRLFHDHILKAEPRYTRRLVMLRQHYALARIQLISYVRLVDDLGEY
ncbi:MAG: hypothetical protein K9M57_09875 [Phycisphaerae bacterium]|nr:hypothetical protein [Phycisphaerae bacterium]